LIDLVSHDEIRNMGIKAVSFARILVLVGTLAALQTGFSGCNSLDVLATPLDVGPSPSPTPSLGNTNIVLQKYQPALAVRGMECLICHAQINSSIITDFGYGDPQYFVNQNAGTLFSGSGFGNSNTITNDKPLTLPWYGNYFGSWQLAAQVTGTIVVPQVMITDQRTLDSVGASGPISLAQLVALNTGAGFYADDPYSGEGPIDSMVTPLSGNPTVTEISQLYIGAPTVAQILGVTPNPSNMALGVQAVGATSSISGLSVVSGTGGSYITNTASGGVIKCYGDIVVTGPLFLNNVTVTTDNNGCRLLVTQSAFVQGNVTYSNDTGTENLQISSAEAILMGFDTSTLSFRLSQWYLDAQPLTRYNGGTNTQKNAAILAEAAIIGAGLMDATDSAACPNDNMITYQANNGGSISTLTQCGINFQHLLLNAPNIQSRYVGQFTGVAIAEIALFAPGALNFAYDPTFNTVPILPLLPPMIESPGCSGPLCGGGAIGI
jgi:hypothetical protein